MTPEQLEYRRIAQMESVAELLAAVSMNASLGNSTRARHYGEMLFWAGANYAICEMDKRTGGAVAEAPHAP